MDIINLNNLLVEESGTSLGKNLADKIYLGDTKGGSSRKN